MLPLTARPRAFRLLLRWAGEGTRRPGAPDGGFTILEMLVSVSLLTLVVVLAAGMVELTARSWQSGKAQADNYAKARSAIDLITREVRSCVIKRDVVAFTDPANQPDFRILTVRTATKGERELQTLRYVVGGLSDPEPTLNQIGLFRTSRKWGFADRAQVSPSLDLSVASETQQISPGILGFAYRFYDTTGAVTKRFQFDFDTPEATTNTHLLRIACVVVDDRSLALMEKRKTLKKLVQDVQKDADDETDSPGGKWKTTFSQMLSNGVISSREYNGLRIFEFTIKLPTPQA